MKNIVKVNIPERSKTLKSKYLMNLIIASFCSFSKYLESIINNKH